MADKFVVWIDIPVLPLAPDARTGFVRIYSRNNLVYQMDENGTEQLLTNVAAPPSSGGEVTAERLQYDNYEKARRLFKESVSSVVSSKETNRKAMDTVVAGVLTQAIEPNRKSTDAHQFAVLLSETADRAIDYPSAIFAIYDIGKKATDSHSFVPSVYEIADKAVETISNTVNANLQDSGKRAVETISIPVSISDIAKKATETITIPMVVIETIKPAVETISIPVSISDIAKKATESIVATIAHTMDTGKRASDSEYVGITYNGYANAVVSNSNWTNPNNVLGNNSTTASSLSATSSGLLGTTSNTTTGTIVLGLADPQITDIPLTGSTIIVRVETWARTAGVLPLGQAWNVSFQYSINGSTWNTIITHTATSNQTTTSLDITSIIANSYTNLNNLQIRATGSVTSGTGISAQAYVDFYRAFVSFAVNKTY